MAEQMVLTDVQTLHGRGEELGRDQTYRAQFDVATARGVAELAVLVELCLPFVKVGGRFLAQKSTNCDQEVASANLHISKLGGEIAQIATVEVPNTGNPTCVIVIEKIAPTPPEFPRRWAKITRDMKKG